MSDKRIVASLGIRLSTDLAEFQQGMNKAVKKFKRMSNQIKKVGKNLSKNLTLPIIGAGAGMLVASNRAADYADKIDKASIRTGLARKTLQELAYVADQAGVEYSSIEGAVTKLTRSMSDADYGSIRQVQAFKKLGMSVRDSNGEMRKMKDVFPEVIGKLSLMDNETERNALSMELFGRGALTLVPLLAELGSKGIAELTKKANDLGLVMGDNAISDLVAYKDSMSTLKQEFQAVSRKIAIGFIPIIQTVIVLIRQNIIPLVQRWVTSFSKLSQETKKIIIVIAGVVAAIGPLLFVFGKIISIVPMLINGIGSFIKALKFLKMSMLFLTANPYAMILTGIAVAIAALAISFNKSTKISSEFTSNLKKEKTAIDDVFGSLKSSETGHKERAEAIKTINSNYGSYLSNMVTEKTSLEDIKKAQAEVLNGKIEDLAFESQRKQIADLGKDKESATVEFYKAIDGISKKLDATQKGTFTALVENYKETLKSSKDYLGYFHDYIVSDIADIYKDVSGMDMSLGFNSSNAEGAIKTLIIEESSLDKKTKELKSSYDAYIKTLKELYGLKSGDSGGGGGSASKRNMIEPGKTGESIVNSTDIKPFEPDEYIDPDKLAESQSRFLTWGKKLIDVGAALEQSFSSLGGSLASSLGTAVEAMAAGEMGISGVLNSILMAVLDWAKQFGEQLIAAGFAAVAFKSLLATPWTAIAAGAALVVAASVVKGTMQRGPKAPKLAKGGLAYGETMATVGDNVNAHIDPEVISPLSKLKELISPSMGMPSEVRLVARGGDMVGMLNFHNRKNRSTR